MKLKIKLTSNNNIILPKGFNYQMQGLIYSLLDNISADWLHNTGFKYEKRTFKHFVFSSILEKGRYNKCKEIFTFPKNVSFTISSPIHWILEQVAKNIVMNEEVRLGKNIVLVSSIEVIKIDEILDDKIRIKTITPVEVHSTLKKPDGGDFTHFYEPAEKDFSRLICENMQKKWSSLNDGEECKYSLKIYPVKKELMKPSRQSFKGFFIKAWHGHFWMEGDKELLELALESGIGSKNSAGFGMIGVVGKR